MVLIHRRYQQAINWQDDLPPLVRRRIIEKKEESRPLFIIFGHSDTFKMIKDIPSRTVVDLKSKNSDCGEWDISTLLFPHALYCIDAMKYNVSECMNPLLKMEAFKNTYKHQLYPILKQATSLST